MKQLKWEMKRGDFAPNENRRFKKSKKFNNNQKFNKNKKTALSKKQKA